MTPEMRSAIDRLRGYSRFRRIDKKTAEWGVMPWRTDSREFRFMMQEIALNRMTSDHFFECLRDGKSRSFAGRSRARMIDFLEKPEDNEDEGWFVNKRFMRSLSEVEEIRTSQARFMYLEKGIGIETDLEKFGIKPSVKLCFLLLGIRMKTDAVTTTQVLIKAFNASADRAGLTAEIERMLRK